jgi:hypothetical protein
MYRSASKSRATQNAVRTETQRGPKRARYLVVAFRRGRDNKGRPCVYRRVWTESFPDAAQSRLRWLPDSYEHALIVDARGETVYSTGPMDIVDEWNEQRKGANRDADWRTAGQHELRNLGIGGESAVADHNDLEECRERLRTAGWRRER